MCTASHVAEERGVQRVTAQEGDNLVTRLFRISHFNVTGFADPKASSNLVCVLPESVVKVKMPRAIRKRLQLDAWAEALLVYTRGPDTRLRDTLRFLNAEIALEEVGSDVRVTVLRVPASGTRTPQPELVGAA